MPAPDPVAGPVATPPGPAWARVVLVATRQLWRTWSTGPAGLRAAYTDERRLLIATIWLVGIALDDVFTYALLTTPGFAEGNAFAAVLMTHLGVVPVIVASTLACLAWLLLAVATPVGSFGKAAVVAAVGVGVVKLSVGLHNAWLYFDPLTR